MCPHGDRLLRLLCRHSGRPVVHGDPGDPEEDYYQEDYYPEVDDFRDLTTATSSRPPDPRPARPRIARALREAQEPRFRLDESGALVPDVRAEAAIIYNPATGQVLWESNSQNQRSIASITKVMTAVVFLEDSPDLSEEVVVQRERRARGVDDLYPQPGYRVTKDDLLHLMLIASDNAAARALARVSSHGSEAFIDADEQQGEPSSALTSTSYADPSGLLSANVSSAYDMAKLITYVSR